MKSGERNQLIGYEPAGSSIRCAGSNFLLVQSATYEN